MTNTPTDVIVLTFEARDKVYSSVAASRALVRRLGMTQVLAENSMTIADYYLSQGKPYKLVWWSGNSFNWLRLDLIGAGYVVSTYKE